MADELEFNVDTKALDAALSQLGIKAQGEILEAALQAGAEVSLKAMKGLCPESTKTPGPKSTSLPPGMLRYDLTSSVKIRSGKVGVAKIGPTAVGKHVARWINNGWALTKGGRRINGKNKGKGKVLRVIPGTHFMEASFDASKQETLNAMIQTISDKLTSKDTAASSEMSNA